MRKTCKPTSKASLSLLVLVDKQAKYWNQIQFSLSSISRYVICYPSLNYISLFKGEKLASPHRKPFCHYLCLLTKRPNTEIEYIVFFNRSSRRKRGTASNPLFIIPDFFLHFPNELCNGYLKFEGNGKISLGR